MISREPTLERLAIAQQLLIDPFGLDEAKLAAALGVIGEHRIDDAQWRWHRWFDNLGKLGRDLASHLANSGQRV